MGIALRKDLMTTKYLKRLAVSTILTILMAMPLNAAISEEDAGYIAGCRLAIIDGQLPGGVIPLVAYRDFKVDIEPYFANLACLGLLSGHNFSPDSANSANSQNLKCVLAWLKWYAANQDPNGTMGTFHGQMQNDVFVREEAVDPPDSHDSYAATYLSLVDAYLEAGGTLEGSDLVAVKEACIKCFSVLKSCFDSESGFYNNFIPSLKPAGTTVGQYLLDNTEVHQGLRAAARLFTRWKDDKNSEDADTMSAALAGRMHKFWYPEQAYFVTLYGERASKKPWGTRPTNAKDLKESLATKGVTTVSALAFFDNVPDRIRNGLWQKLLSTYRSDLEDDYKNTNFNEEDVAIERAYFAGIKVASASDKGILLGFLRKRAKDFIGASHHYTWPYAPSIPYIHRYGMIIQGLLSQDGELPAELPRVPLSGFNHFAPAPVITSPANGSGLKTLASINGTAVAGASGGTITGVFVSLQRTDGKYWTGDDWGSQTLLSASRTGNSWSLSTGLPAGTNLPDETYAAIAYSDNTAGNRSDSSPVSFVIDNANPNVAVTNPANNSTTK